MSIQLPAKLVIMPTSIIGSTNNATRVLMNKARTEISRKVTSKRGVVKSWAESETKNIFESADLNLNLA